MFRLLLLASLATLAICPPNIRAQELAPFQTSGDAAVKKDLRTLLQELRVWAAQEALPSLAHIASGVDEKFGGVRGMGALLTHLDYSQPIDAEALTFRNPVYWRGVVEMAPGDHLVSAMPALLFAANGETDKAYRLLNILNLNAQPGNLASSLLDQLAERLRPIRAFIREEIKRGVALHDEGRYDEAINVYENLLALKPGSALARYELYFSQVHNGGPDSMAKAIIEGKKWEEAAIEIYRIDPLHTTQALGKRGVSMGSLSDRLHLAILFKEEPSDVGELVGTYADLATRLESYGFAAHLYWIGMAASLRGPGYVGDKVSEISQEQVLARFLYCLEKLGTPDLKNNFKGNFPKAFKKFDKDLRKHRTQ